ncbi:MAG: HEAT repeat domain-containing protein [Kofleriaceae bacterium]
MARGSRVPSPLAYRGAIGRTQTRLVHVTASSGELVAAQVYTTVDAVSHPELAERLRCEDLGRALNVLTEGSEPVRVATPVIYHDPAAELLVLVLDDSQRHRELDERITVLKRMREDDAVIPPYAKDFTVVYGASGLNAYLEQRASQALEAARSAEATRDHERRLVELEAREAEVVRRATELDKRAADLERRVAERAVAQASAPTLIARDQAITVVAPAPVAAPAPALDPDQAPTLIAERDETTPLPLPLPTPEDDAELPRGTDSLTTGTTEETLDGALAAPSPDISTLTVDGSTVRLALVAGSALSPELEGGPLDIRVLLHRTPIYPVVTLVVGPPLAMRTGNLAHLVTVPLDVALAEHQAALSALAQRFELVVDVISAGEVIRRAVLRAPLAENVAYVLTAATEQLTEGNRDRKSFERATEIVLASGYDLLGTQHRDAAELREDKASSLATAQQVRRALAMAKRFARPASEDYLIATRGFPIVRWRELRRRVLEASVAWGLWMGPELADIAVTEGFASSRHELVTRLQHGFAELREHPTAFDLDPDAAEDNASALAHELGEEQRNAVPRARPAVEDISGVISGSIGGTPPVGVPTPPSTDSLIARLDDRHHRVAAAIELCRRADPRAAAPVISSVSTLSRGEAVRILGMCVKFGEAAVRPLQDGLASSKGFLRQGCALALGLLRTDEGTQAVIDLLIDEPTEIWREVARAIGQIGPSALMPLASRFGRLGDRSPAITERVAWAMAHIAVRGGKPAVETMANGQSVLAPVARQALELHASAARDQVHVTREATGSQPGREITVNRAFSRRFFEALEHGLPDAVQAGLVAMDSSSPMELLDDAELIEDDDEAVLDETDLIQT